NRSFSFIERLTHIDVLGPATGVALIKNDVVCNPQCFSARVPLVSFILRVDPRDGSDGQVCFAGETANGKTEKLRARELRGFFSRQLPGPRDPRFRVRARSCRLILTKPRRLFSCRITPVVPTFRSDVRPQPAVNENYTRVRTPRPPEIDSVACVLSSQTAMQKNKTGIL